MTESTGIARLFGLLDELELADEDSQFVRKAAEDSYAFVERTRSSKAVETAVSGSGELDFVAFGSVARWEMTPGSDLDYLILNGVDDADAYLGVAARIREASGFSVSLSEPSPSGLFGGVVSLEQLCSNIGLNEDSNHNLSRRVLLIEESTSLRSAEHHRSSLEAVIRAYVDRHESKTDKVPRYLLNDIVRYWRTIAVDFQAKSADPEKGSLRYLKLLISRKLCYVSSLKPLYDLHCDPSSDPLSTLVNGYATPASLRLVDLLSVLSSSNPEVMHDVQFVIKTFNDFLKRTGDPEWRAVLASKSEIGIREFEEMRKSGKQLHESLLSLLFAPKMLDFTREYLVV